MQISQATPAAIQRAADILKSGGLVAFPTETVYGLGANALDGHAVAQIFAAKGRPAFNPLITHVPDLKTAQKYAEFDDTAKAVAHAFWPGALTLIVPLKPKCGISGLVTAGLETIGLRVPKHKCTQNLLKACALPIAAPSANTSGSLSPTTAKAVADTLGDKPNMILADGSCEIGLESTILDLTGDTPAILRPGVITAEDIARIIDRDVIYAYDTAKDALNAPKSPGQLLKHYAPNTPVRLKAVDIEPTEALLAFGSTRFMSLRGGGHVNTLPASQFRNLSESGDLHEAAANLFAYLKALDQSAHKRIAVMDIPETGLGIAINDRLRRAAAK